jgi:hypothetical protein
VEDLTISKRVYFLRQRLEMNLKRIVLMLLYILKKILTISKIVYILRLGLYNDFETKSDDVVIYLEEDLNHIKESIYLEA